MKAKQERLLCFYLIPRSGEKILGPQQLKVTRTQKGVWLTKRLGCHQPRRLHGELN